jgi:hypothetical protein
VEDAYVVEFLLQGALTGLHGPWQDVYRYLRCTLHFKFGFAQVSIEVILCVQIQMSSSLEHPLAFRPSSIVHENLYSRGQPRHQCLPFQVEACGRCQSVFGSHICSRADVVRLDRPQGPWQMLLASTLRPWFVWPGKLSYAPLPQPSLLDPPSCSFERSSVLTINSLLLLVPRTTPSFALFCGCGLKRGRRYQICLEKMGQARKCCRPQEMDGR